MADTHNVRAYPTASERILAKTVATAKCGVKTLDGKLRCELLAGHAGAHMHFGTNGTTAWGGMS